MASTSTRQLSETLRRKRDQDAERFDRQTQEKLNEHGEHLAQLASDSLSAAKDATQSETNRLSATLHQHRSEIESMTESLRATHQRESRRLRWVMRLPLLIVLIAFLLLSAGIWGWWQVMQPWQVMQMDDGQDYQVITGDWTTCEVRGETLPCRPKPDGLIDSIRR